MIDFCAGDLLVSPPNIPDPRFNKSVILLTAHQNSEGSFGLCINKPTEYSINDIIEPLSLQLDNDITVYWGGPMSSHTVWMIHEPGWAVNNTMVINEHWSLTSHESMFHHLADGDYPERYRFIIGHASWAPNQLEGEVNGESPWSHKHSWLIVKNPDPNWLVNIEIDKLWTGATGLCSQQTVLHWME